MIHPCILSGGSGTRLWPVSRNFAPKQLQPLISERSMIRETAMRFDAESEFADPTIISNASYAEQIADNFADGTQHISAIIAEPGRRDTAAAAALAAFYVGDVDPEDHVLLLPSDHHIRYHKKFADMIRRASQDCDGVITTFGIIPTHPDTGFGYIKRDEAAAKFGELFAVEAFVEKPNSETAQSYLDDGGYYWNSGIFLFKPKTFLEELERHQPQIFSAVSQAWVERKTQDYIATQIVTPSDSFLNSEAISLDYAIMEKTDVATVLPVDIGWDDVGSWSALRGLQTPDDCNNVIRGDVQVLDTQNTYIESRSRLVVATGVSDLIIVDTDDALLVCGSAASQTVKAAHSKLLKLGRKEAHYHSDLSSRRLGLRHWYHGWLREEALPFWKNAAINAKSKLPYEAIQYDGLPIGDTVRTRVLSRQIFTYAFASQHFGWNTDGSAETISALTDVYMDRVRTGKGSVARLNLAGTTVDNRWDTYDQAFHLLAMAWAYRATGNDKYVAYGKVALDEIYTDLRHPVAGFKEGIEATLPRRANPHMHLLEASLAWLPTDHRSTFQPLGEEVVELFHNKFCRKGLLYERFDDLLTDLIDAKSPTALEPGHLVEWSTLIKIAGADGIRSDDVGRVSTMIGFSDAYGKNPETGLLYDKCSSDGMQNSATHRLWPQTEMVRHHLLYGTAPQQKAALDMLETIKSHYLDPGKVKGLWRDKLSESLKDLGDRSPASTFYHLINMIAVI